MSPTQAVLAGAVLIAASIVFVNAIRPAAAQLSSSGPFQIMHHSNGSANAGVFRLDTSSGDVSYCYVTGPSQITCSPSVH